MTPKHDQACPVHQGRQCDCNYVEPVKGASAGNSLSDQEAMVFEAAHLWAQEAYRKGLGRDCDIDGKRSSFKQALRAALASQSAAQEPVKGGDVQAAPLPELPSKTLLRTLHADRKPETPFLIYGYTADQLRAYGDARALAALSQGWVSVPQEPTDEMLKAGRKAVHDSHSASKKAGMVYAAMLAAAPKAADGSGGEAA